MAYMIIAISALGLFSVWDLFFRRRHNAIIPSRPGKRPFNSRKHNDWR